MTNPESAHLARENTARQKKHASGCNHIKVLEEKIVHLETELANLQSDLRKLRRYVGVSDLSE